MQRRHSAMLAGLAVVALTVGVGCPDDNAGEKGAPKPKPTTATTAAAATSAAAAPSGKPAAAAAVGNGTMKGTVKFTGKAPEMKVPSKRKDTDFCKTKEVKYNAVLVKDGKLQDVLVRIKNGEVKGKFDAPTTHAMIEQKDCMYSPRIQGVVAEQSIDIKNDDGTLHNVHTFKGSETLFNQAQPKGSDAISKSWDDGIVKFTCDVHPWMRGFVVVTDHPFFSVSKEDGTFEINKIPAGKYAVEAWHSQFGLKTGSVEVADGKPATWDIEFTDKDAEPAENKGELNGLW
jgi:hypothetical protein